MALERTGCCRKRHDLLGAPSYFTSFCGRLYKDFFGRAFEIFEEGRTQPSFHFPLWPAIPIASVFGSSPNESGGVAWKGSCREDDFESRCGLRNMFGQHIQNVI